MKTKITIAIVAIFVIGAIAIIVSNKGSSQSASSTTSASHETTNPGATTASTTTVTGKTYTLADVAKHKGASSCWTAIDGKVYDVTLWIDQHPGGRDAILATCGIDASSAFNDQHGGQRRPAQELATFLIGDLAK